MAEKEEAAKTHQAPAPSYLPDPEKLAQVKVEYAGGKKGSSAGPLETRIPPKGGSSTAPPVAERKKEEKPPPNFAACSSLWLNELHRRSEAFTSPKAATDNKAMLAEIEVCAKITELIDRIQTVGGLTNASVHVAANASR